MSTTLHTEIVKDLLKLAVESGASDIVIKSEKPGYVRIGGRLRPVEMDPISCEHAQAWVDEHVPRIFKDKWDKDGQVDFAYSSDDVGRFRVNAFHQRGLVSIVMRHMVWRRPPTRTQAPRPDHAASHAGIAAVEEASTPQCTHLRYARHLLRRPSRPASARRKRR